MSVPYELPGRRIRGRTAPNSLHEGCPWRAVVHIVENEGPRGGLSWELTLECGHRAFRKLPPARPGRMLFPGTEPRTAPCRVRCLWCGPMAQSSSLVQET